MAWATIGYNYKSELYFVSYEGEGKGFTQKKYAEQILKALVKMQGEKGYRLIIKIIYGRGLSI